MPYKDPDKQREANRKAVQAHRLRKRAGIAPVVASEVRVLQASEITDAEIEALPDYLKERINLEMRIRASQGLSIPLRKIQEAVVKAYRHK